MSEETAELDALARRTLDLMQDQISAQAADRQSAEQMQRWLQTVLQISGPLAAAQAMAGAMSANAMAGWAGLWQQGYAGAAAAGGTEENDAGSPRAGGRHERAAPGHATVGTPPSDAASGDGGVRLEQLEARLAELETALARATAGRSAGPGEAGQRSGTRQRKRKT